ncbi:MAG: NAD(P)H-dependent oxidoreductase subunit E, partial [Dehalococcoidia bacterium]|nr:NAD(P)H-dependent oxidoreductase subunit E [Dehalococcoidia bacterium]
GPLLYLAQDKDGYISNESIVEISGLIGITEVQVQSVASFYSMYKQEPTGKYLLSVCKSISCEISKSSDVINSVKNFTGLSNNETDDENFFTYESVECIGACGGAPAIQVNYETVEGPPSNSAEVIALKIKKPRVDKSKLPRIKPLTLTVLTRFLAIAVIQNYPLGKIKIVNRSQINP